MIETFLAAFWQVLLQLSPSLLVGLLIAGLIHVYLPTGFIHRGLSQPNLRSVARAALVGLPLPLCSCGVIPAALGLRNEGASKGATTAFMMSTPQTGADAVLVSAAFLGWPFALFMVAAAFITGLVGGVLVNRFTPADAPVTPPVTATGAGAPARGGLAGVLRYAVIDVLGAIDLWIVFGVVVAVLIGLVLPADFFASQAWAQGPLGMLAVLAIALPLYVCTTGSVPIAASLIAAGLPAGSAVVFLMAGPATNVATFGAVYRTLGTRVLAIYLGTTVVLSLLFGVLFDGLIQTPAGVAADHAHASGQSWIGVLSALILIGLLVWLSGRRLLARLFPPAPVASDLTLRVQGMTCMHCVASVKRALEGCAAVDEATPELTTGVVRVHGRGLDRDALVAAVEKAGFQVAKSA